MTLNVLDAMKRIPGTTNVQIFGAKDYAMRIWVRPDRLAQLKLTSRRRHARGERAERAVRRRQDRPVAGEQRPQELVYTITTKGRFAEPEQFENIVVRANPDGSILRLKDVARVELGSKDYEFMGRVNGKAATLIGIFLQPGANALATGERVTNELTRLSARFPQGLDLFGPVRHDALRQGFDPRGGDHARAKRWCSCSSSCSCFSRTGARR